ncbi:hypothetical protein AMAG_05495 [Allomyces macrogynus ATCC 38327]|uniref:UTP--glucose-1-phosphate uridylyltransferase n=1 Tax=Allomyces macrogynus (strain ATCC 38327) TaxID=578462 RepID=A0A0L0SBY7_ALLM3|nr:hypothetical protein AMAG_05495 [Allomyces macrogynus ATCC 38327]|eukprot:KNE60063.1 hypothetical protein AMAG_05495 [Allomyces macrogynus ATCC 38327]
MDFSPSTPTTPMGNPMSHDRTRSLSMQGFEEVKNSVAAKTMRAELNKLVNMLPDSDRREARFLLRRSDATCRRRDLRSAACRDLDLTIRKRVDLENEQTFRTEMDNFYMLFTRYLADRAKGQKLDWAKIKSPGPETIVPYAKLRRDEAAPPSDAQLLSKLAVLKLNGGLGTTMGCVGPKSAIEVRDGLTFLDLTVRQIEFFQCRCVERFSPSKPPIIPPDHRGMRHPPPPPHHPALHLPRRLAEQPVDLAQGHQAHPGRARNEHGCDVNVKTSKSGEKVIQLETAVAAAIRFFKSAHGINVPRSRFLPVKSTSDLFLITSDLYSLDHGQLVMNPQRLFGTIPIVKLGDHYKKVADYQARFKGRPRIIDLDHLTLSGNVYFGSDITLGGTVIIVASEGSRIDIPSGARLEDKVVTGNLRILDH